ncbi:MAG TPA: nickel-dependent hydrogenase large subunit [Rhodocyclaceae bacterium]|nr:nickel-dependent hydrogenase large subunit [Rhodocyclaceae bacterium]
MARRTVQVDLNRVEGDLEFQLDLEGDTVVDARCIGTLYRGFEQILVGRAPRDALVITPRVCGICGTAHLYAACLALEHLAGLSPPAHAVLVRNLCLTAETVQSDLRQSFLFFTPDLCHARYAGHALAGELHEAFAPLRGRVVRECLRATRDLLGIVAVFGGQWPHSSHILPGGVTAPATPRRILDCRGILDGVRRWFEGSLVGGPLADWLAIDRAEDFFRWLSSPAGAASAIGLFSRASRDLGLHRVGAGAGLLLSYGAWCEPDAPRQPSGAPAMRIRSGVRDATVPGAATEALDQEMINEHVRHSWYLEYPGGRHPWRGETIPNRMADGGRYTWAKAPRYGDRVAQTGPLAQLAVDGDALILSLLAAEGDSAWLRQFARLRRAGLALEQMRGGLDDLGRRLGEPHYADPGLHAWPDGESFGLIEAARGALGHWLRVRDGCIDGYQIVTPTAWNASPRDSAGRHGHWEESVIGLRVADEADPIEVGHVVRSHDPCLVCTVHCIGTGRRTTYGV